MRGNVVFGDAEGTINHLMDRITSMVYSRGRLPFGYPFRDWQFSRRALHFRRRWPSRRGVSRASIIYYVVLSARTTGSPWDLGWLVPRAIRESRKCVGRNNAGRYTDSDREVVTCGIAGARRKELRLVILAKLRSLLRVWESRASSLFFSRNIYKSVIFRSAILRAC